MKTSSSFGDLRILSSINDEYELIGCVVYYNRRRYIQLSGGVRGIHHLISATGFEQVILIVTSLRS
jgi:hypothetical protein